MKRDWMTASDRAAHLMDALQRQLIEVEYIYPQIGAFTAVAPLELDEPGWNRFTDHVYLTFHFKSREWDMEIRLRDGKSEARLATTEVPAWLIDQLPDETKAEILRVTIEKKDDDDPDIPF